MLVEVSLESQYLLAWVCLSFTLLLMPLRTSSITRVCMQSLPELVVVASPLLFFMGCVTFEFILLPSWFRSQNEGRIQCRQLGSSESIHTLLALSLLCLLLILNQI